MSVKIHEHASIITKSNGSIVYQTKLLMYDLIQHERV